MPDVKYSLSWNAYQNKICQGIGVFQQNGEFVDMTLAADGHHVQVHKMVMSLASPYIKDLLKSAQCSHPIIFLNNISYATLHSILEYVYTGEVVVAKENLNLLLEASQALHLQGLDNMMDFLQENNDYKSDEEKRVTNYHLTHEQVQRMSGNSKTMNEDVVDDGVELSYLYEPDAMLRDDQSDQVEYKISVDSKTNCAAEKLPLEKNSLQYTLSNHGNLQIVVNRYIYNLKYTSKTLRSMWRCVQHQRKQSCLACVVTKGNHIVERKNNHNHPFHDEKILKKYSVGAIFSGIDEARRELVNFRNRKENEGKCE